MVSTIKSQKEEIWVEFDYDYYRRALFIGEIIMLVVGLYLLISFIILVLNRKFISYNMFKKIFYTISSLAFSFFFIIYSIGHLYYGIYLIRETPNDALVVQGEIEQIKELKNPFVHNYKYATGYGPEHYKIKDYNAHLITISRQ